MSVPSNDNSPVTIGILTTLLDSLRKDMLGRMDSIDKELQTIRDDMRERALKSHVDAEIRRVEREVELVKVEASKQVMNASQKEVEHLNRYRQRMTWAISISAIIVTILNLVLR